MFEGKKIHFIGIGGISMSGIADILMNMGAIISGSDMQESKIIEDLRKKGAHIEIGENKELIDNVDIIVYTAAIQDDNKELMRAKELNKELYERAKFLGILSKNYENVLCIAGTHGKSTTTGMISTIFLEANLDPTIQIGAILPKINSNSHVGSNKYIIMESCEYVDSFLSFYPTSAVILNIDDDHLDYFKNIDNIKASFTKFINLLPNNGNLIINVDDENTSSLKLPDNINIYSYAINKDAKIVAKNIVFDDFGHPEFDIYYNNELFIHLKLQVLGLHNVYNALASTSMAIIYNVNKDAIIKGLESYVGVERRFELIGTYKDNILVYDDYAHHPTEIKSTVLSTKSIKCHQNWIVFQSHTYSRTSEHLKEFASVLKDFDNIIIAPIYPARETNIYDVHESQLVDLIKPYNKNVCYIDSFDKIVDYLKENLEDNDLVITVGAGPVNKVGLQLLEK